MTFTDRKLTFLVTSSLFMLGAVSVSGCEHLAARDTENPSVESQTLEDASLSGQIVRQPKINTGTEIDTEGSAPQFEQKPSQIGRIPILSERPDDEGDTRNRRPPPLKVKKVDAFVKPLILPEFIDIVFGEMLQIPYVTGPGVAKLTSVVQLRSSGEMKAGDFMALVSSALEEYGVRVVPEDGAYRILEDKALLARRPRFIKSRARLRTRDDLRPVVQFVELNALDANGMLGFLNQAFGAINDKLTIKADPRTNYITLSGLPADVDAALAIIRELDELRFAGSAVRRYSPRYWNADDLSTELTRALTVEGWQVSTNINTPRIIYIMPVEYSNDLFIFTKSATALGRVDTWLKELDRPIDGGDRTQIYVYQVKNVDATLLAETVNSVLSAQTGGARQQQGGGATGRPPATPSGAPLASARPSFGASGQFTVDPLGNRIIFSGTISDYDRMIALLEQLDTPAPEVLIEVQIAEVTLADNTNFGVELFIDDLGGSTVSGTAGTGGLGLGNSGLTVALLSGNVDATFNAFATNRRVKLLSTPILTARSGSTAEIQVGTDVPIITSQRAADNQTGSGPTDILQNITYRSTGVLLSIEPIVFSDNRIDLTISQEVSSTIDTAGSTISSPTISNRSISTQLSLEDGQTAVLGGLIQETYIVDERGVPILKDIPFIGQIFSADSLSVDRTELVVLITAYILRDQADKTQFVNHLSRRIDNYITDQGRLVTLLPKQF